MFYEKNKRNVFLINWSKLGSIYLFNASNLGFVADKIKEFISKLKEKFSVPNANFDFVGFSLGVYNIAYNY